MIMVMIATSFSAILFSTTDINTACVPVLFSHVQSNRRHQECNYQTKKLSPSKVSVAINKTAALGGDSGRSEL